MINGISWCRQKIAAYAVIGKCKFKNSAFNLSELTATTKKSQPSKKNAQVYYYLFLKSGFTDEVRQTAKEKNITLVGVEEILGI